LKEIIIFNTGLGLTLYAIFALWWVTEARKAKGYDPESEELLLEPVVVGIGIIIFSFLVMTAFRYLYKPLTQDEIDMFIAGCITGFLIMTVSRWRRLRQRYLNQPA